MKFVPQYHSEAPNGHLREVRTSSPTMGSSPQGVTIEQPTALALPPLSLYIKPISLTCWTPHRRNNFPLPPLSMLGVLCQCLCKEETEELRALGPAQPEEGTQPWGAGAEPGTETLQQSWPWGHTAAQLPSNYFSSRFQIKRVTLSSTAPEVPIILPGSLDKKFISIIHLISQSLTRSAEIRLLI